MLSARVLAVLGLLAGGVSSATAETPLAELFHQSWGIRQGAPGAVVSITQTSDGYLWLASPGGLYRFDGTQFERFLPGSGTLPRRIVKLAALPDGGLLIGSSNDGVSRLLGDEVVPLGLEARLPSSTLWDLDVDAEGRVWAATAMGVFLLDDRSWIPVGDDWDLHPGPARSIHVARDGGIWLGTDAGLFQVDSRRRKVLATHIRHTVTGIAQAPDGSIWIFDGARTMPVERLDASGIRRPDIPVGSRHLLFTSDAALWSPTPQGVARVIAADPLRIETFGRREGLSTDNVFAVFQDREGNIWIGTGAGLDFFRETALRGSVLPAGTHALRLARGSRGAIWVGSQNEPLVQLRGDSLVRLGVPPPVTSVVSDGEDGVWAWSGESLWRVDGRGRAQKMPSPSPGSLKSAWSMARDGAGRLWVSSVQAGLHVFHEGVWTRPSIPGLDPADTVRLTFSDESGRVWLSVDDRLLVVENGRVRSLTQADGLRTGRIGAIASGRSVTWVAGDAGLAAVDHDGARMIRGVGSETVGRITGVVEAADGDVWLNTDRGVVWLSEADVRLAFDLAEHTPALRVFDYLDGAIGGAALIPPQSAVQTSDRRLWFVGFESLVSLDPASMRRNEVPPPVHLQFLMSGGERYEPSAELTLPVGASDLQIRYAGLSLSMPERVRFRYRLEGVEAHWQEAGTRREAFYTNLAPGRYRFHVIAANNDGLWNEAGASMAIVVPAAFHQAAWFRGLAVIALAGAAWGMYRRRVHQITQQMHARIEERLTERERIARELHDTLLQGVQGLMLRFQAIATRLPPSDPAAQLMEEALSRADDVIVQGRDRVRGLRGSGRGTDDLAHALARVGEELKRDAHAGFHLSAVGEPRPLHPVVRDEAFWIGREALVNAFHHAQGEQVEVEVVYGSRDFRVRLRDNGRGLDPDVVSRGGRPEHWGLPGMRERAARIGAQLGLRSRPGAGTEVELRIPAAMAYIDPPHVRRRWWRTRASGDHGAGA